MHISSGLALVLIPPQLQGPPRKLLRSETVEFERRSETRPDLVKVLDLEYAARRAVQLKHFGSRLEKLRTGDADFLSDDSGKMTQIISTTAAGPALLLGGLILGNESAVPERVGLEERVPRLEREQE